MRSLTYSDARFKLASVFDRVVEDREPVIITKKGEKSVVMIALEDYEAMGETAYLLRYPVNAQRLQKSIEQLESGKGKVRELGEE